MIPSVPSAPMNKCLMSYPVLSFLIVVMLSRISPFGSTAFRPTQFAWSELFRMNLVPPALVDRLPPIMHEPLEPRSKGMSKEFTLAWSYRSLSIQPASAESIPNDVSKSLILFILDMLKMTSSYVGTEPATKLVLPPCGTTAIFRLLQYLSTSDTSSEYFGLTASLDYPTNRLVQSVL